VSTPEELNTLAQSMVERMAKLFEDAAESKTRHKLTVYYYQRGRAMGIGDVLEQLRGLGVEFKYPTEGML
jgi:TRAP-type C4-dicarboxylate transport system substrate-binding protein